MIQANATGSKAINAVTLWFTKLHAPICAAESIDWPGSAGHSTPGAWIESAQLPGSACASGAKISFHEAGFTLIEPTLYMKSKYFITLSGVRS